MQNGRRTWPNVANTLQNGRRTWSNVANTLQNDRFWFQIVANTRQMVPGKKAHSKTTPEPKKQNLFYTRFEVLLQFCSFLGISCHFRPPSESPCFCARPWCGLDFEPKPVAQTCPVRCCYVMCCHVGTRNATTLENGIEWI